MLLIPSRRFISSVNHVTVIGAGLMGAGIVQVAAASGYQVTMYYNAINERVDTTNEAITKGNKIIYKSLERIAKKKFEGNASETQKYFRKLTKP